MSRDSQKIAEFEDRYGYTPKPYLRDGINDARYYQLANKYPNEESRYIAAVRLFAVVFPEPKVAPPKGKQREVIRQWLLWLSRRQEYDSAEELLILCKKATGTGSVDIINSIITQTLELANWRKASEAPPQTNLAVEALAPSEDEEPVDSGESSDTSTTKGMTDFELLESFKNTEAYRSANAKDKRAMKKAFAEMSYEERVLYFAVD